MSLCTHEHYSIFLDDSLYIYIWCLPVAARIVSASMMTQFEAIRQPVAEKSVPNKHGAHSGGDWYRSPIGGRMQLQTTLSIARHFGESTQAEESYSVILKWLL